MPEHGGLEGHLRCNSNLEVCPSSKPANDVTSFADVPFLISDLYQYIGGNYVLPTLHNLAMADGEALKSGGS